MADKGHLRILKQGATVWNRWRENNPQIQPDLSSAILTEINLYTANLSGASLLKAQLSRADLSKTNCAKANFRDAILSEANFSKANLRGAHFQGADLTTASLTYADCRKSQFRSADLGNANLTVADFSNANLTEAILSRANLFGVNFSGANLSRANLEYAILVETNLTKAKLTNCRVHGVSAWNLTLTEAEQSDLVITQPEESTIKVDNLEVAQFIYLLLNNAKLRDVINTIGNKAVLLLGRFTPERMGILKGVAASLRQKEFLPIIFDFERSQERDFTETINILAGLSLFVIADITNPKSSPMELQSTVPDYMVPFVAIIQEGEDPFSMFNDLQKYPWVVKPVIKYDTQANLLLVLEEAVIKPALAMHDRLINKKMKKLKVAHVSDFLKKKVVSS